MAEEFMPWKYKYVPSTSQKIPEQAVTTTYSGLKHADDIVDAANYMSARRGNWVNRSRYVIYVAIIILAIIVLSRQPGGWSNYWKNLKENAVSTLLNVFSLFLFIEILSVWVIDLTFMRGVEYTYSEKYMAGEWKPTKQMTKNSQTVEEFRNTCPGLHKYGRYVNPTLA